MSFIKEMAFRIEVQSLKLEWLIEQSITGVLQVVDAMIAHGGNNTLGECFFFGVPLIVAPVVGDQITNAKRVEETGFGFAIDIINFTQEELAEKLDKLVNDQALRKRWKDASTRIQKENRTMEIAERVVEYIEQL